MSPGPHLEAVLVVVHPVHQAHDRPALVQPANRAIAAQHQRRQLPRIRVGQHRRSRIIVRQKQRRILLRLRAPVEMPVQQRKNAPRRLKQLIAIASALIAARQQPRQRRLAVHQLLAGKPVRPHRRVQRRHQQRRRNSLPADVANRNPHPGLAPRRHALVRLFMEDKKVVVVAAHRPRRTADAMQLQRSPDSRCGAETGSPAPPARSRSRSAAAPSPSALPAAAAAIRSSC